MFGVREGKTKEEDQDENGWTIYILKMKAQDRDARKKLLNVH